jgi:hypothetical protein
MPSEILLTQAFGANGFTIGEVVHVTTDRTVARAQANLAANVAGALGLASGWTVIFGGIDEVLMEAGHPLPVAQQPLFVSATQPGRATTTAPVGPAIAVPIGTVYDASRYAVDNKVVMIFALGAAAAAVAGGSFDLKFSGSFPQNIA